MAIYVNNKNKVTDIFVNINGEKKKIISAWANRNGIPTKVFQSKSNTINNWSGITWADGTDEEIAAMLEAHYNNEINIADYWSVGDERIINLSAMGNWKVGIEINTNGETHAGGAFGFSIIGFDVEELETPINNHTKAAITVQMTNVLPEPGMIDYDTDNYYLAKNFNSNEIIFYSGWKYCRRRVWCNDIFYNALPVNIQTLIKSVKLQRYGYYVNVKKYASSTYDQNTYTSTDKCYLIDFQNVFGLQEGWPKYPYYETENNRIKRVANAMGMQAVPWWSSTNRYSGSSSGAFGYNNITEIGGGDTSYTKDLLYLSVAMCL